MMATNGGAVSETKCTYDVFLSFRGEDTRHTFTCHLYNALCRKGIITFMDDEELQLGDELGPTLVKAIDESRSSIVIFSENYADSSWCLKELGKIHDCMKSKNHRVYPIFYKVDPSDVRHQKGRYGEAITKHETRFRDTKEIIKWKTALTDIADSKGEHLTVEQGRDESKFIDDLVGKIFNKVSPKDLSRNEHIVGRENRVKELKSLLDLESRNITCFLGIHGTGGIGKTTLAKALYDSIYKQFQGSCFLFNVTENSKQIKGLKRLQQKLLSEILEISKIQLKSIEEGTRTIRSRVGLKRVLIVLDDVDDIEQLKNLAGEGDWFGPGSKIIITTRNKHLLNVCRVEKRYEVKELNKKESLELFCQNAFRKNCPESNYEVLSESAVLCCKGLPLALKVLGSHMVGKDLGGWKDALDRYKKTPHEDVQKVLRISYNSLPFNEKNIFLDIACFFKGERLEYVKGVLDACDFFSGDGIATLVNKSLLTVDDYQCLGMHDLIQDMGRDIVKEESGNVGERSRLWHHKDVLQVLDENIGSSKIQGLILDPPKREEIYCTKTVFENMKNLRILIVRNTKFSHEPRYLPNNLSLLDWKYYPSKSFPSNFYPMKIGSFNLYGSPLLVMKRPLKRFDYLTYMNISYCHMITEFPDVSGAMNLRELRLDGCWKLVSIDKSVGRLTNLVVQSASNCPLLETFVPTIYLPSLQNLSFNFCKRLANFPEIKKTMDEPLKITMSGTIIKELPESIKKLNGLNYLEMTGCIELQHLPSSLFMLPNFATLKIGGCRGLRESFRSFEGSHSTCPKLEILHFENADLSDEDLDMIIYNFPNLKDLNVSWNNFVSLPTHIRQSTNLTSLNVSYCSELQVIPKLPSSVEKVDANCCKSLTFNASDMLWSQVRKEIKGLEVMMPKREIPEWLDYLKEGGYPVFDARGKFPAVALAFVFSEVNAEAKETIPVKCVNVGMHLFIENERRRFHSFTVAENHVLLCDLRVLLSLDEWEDGSNDWKTIQVYCETELNFLCSWGVYVYKQHENDETNMKNIRFTCQDPSPSLLSRLDLISKEEKVRNRKQRNNFQRQYRRLRMRIRTLEDGDGGNSMEKNQTGMLYWGGKSMEVVPHTSGLNIEDDEDESLFEWVGTPINGDGRKSQEAGTSSKKRYEETMVVVKKHYLTPECSSEESSEDVEGADDDLNHNIRYPHTHTAHPTCLEILKILLCFLAICLSRYELKKLFT